MDTPFVALIGEIAAKVATAGFFTPQSGGRNKTGERHEIAR